MKTYLVPLILVILAIGLLAIATFFEIPKGMVIFVATLSGAFLALALTGSVGKYLHKQHMIMMAAKEVEILERYYKGE